jgi:hypothetical protein
MGSRKNGAGTELWIYQNELYFSDNFNGRMRKAALRYPIARQCRSDFETIHLAPLFLSSNKVSEGTSRS